VPELDEVIGTRGYRKEHGYPYANLSQVVEKQVEIRTADLLKTNHQLEDEVLLRNKIETALRRW